MAKLYKVGNRFVRLEQVFLAFVFLLTIFGCTLVKEQSFAASKGDGSKVKTPAKNVLLICVDDLRPELNCFGVSYIKSPSIDRLAADGISFRRHYVNAPSCGPSRHTLLTGRYGPAGNNALFKRAEKIAREPDTVFPSMPELFRKNGYTTVSVGKVSHHPGGWGGKDWGDDSIIEIPGGWDRHLMPVGKWQHPRGAMHGLANGQIRIKAGDMEVFQAVEGPDTIYPDGLITEEALKQLDILTGKGEKPFFLAVGIIRPHLPFGAPKKYLDMYDGVKLPEIEHPDKPKGKTTWHDSSEFMKYKRWGRDPRNDEEFATEVRRHYAACVSYADAQVGRILGKLKETGADKNTVIVLWGDHGWHLGEHSIWGKHSLFEEALRSPLIVYYPGIEKAGAKTDAVVETADVFPTLCELTGVSVPEFVHGRSLKNLLAKPESKGHTVIGYSSKATTIRTSKFRMIKHKYGAVELYDHKSPEKETVNVAKKYPGVVKELEKTLAERLKLRVNY